LVVDVGVDEEVEVRGEQKVSVREALQREGELLDVPGGYPDNERFVHLLAPRVNRAPAV